MLRFLADEYLKVDLLRGLLRRQPGLNLVRVQDVDMLGADDPSVLAGALNIVSHLPPGGSPASGEVFLRSVKIPDHTRNWQARPKACGGLGG